MKRIFLSTVFLLSVIAVCNAQSIRAGINIASMSASATEETYREYKNISTVGYQAAFVMPIRLSNSIAIQPELVWIQKGGKSQYIIDDNNKFIVDRKYNYAEIPISLTVSLGNTKDGLGVYLLAGPYFGLAINGNYKYETTLLGVTTNSEEKVDYSDDNNQEKRLDYGANFGVGVTFGKLYFDARYQLGINNLLDNDASNTNDNKPYLRNRGIGITVGFKF